MLFLILPDAHLIIKEGIGLPLDDLKDSGGFLVENEHLRLLEMIRGPSLRRRPLTDSNRPTRMIEVIGSRQCGILPSQSRKTNRQVGIREGDALPALRGVGHRGEDDIDLSGQQRRDQPREGNILDPDGTMERFTQRHRKIDTHTRGLTISTDRLEGGIGKIHPHDQRLDRSRGTFPVAAARGEKDYRRSKEDREDPTFSHRSFGLESQA